MKRNLLLQVKVAKYFRYYCRHVIVMVRREDESVMQAAQRCLSIHTAAIEDILPLMRQLYPPDADARSRGGGADAQGGGADAQGGDASTQGGMTHTQGGDANTQAGDAHALGGDVNADGGTAAASGAPADDVEGQGGAEDLQGGNGDTQAGVSAAASLTTIPPGASGLAADVDGQSGITTEAQDGVSDVEGDITSVRASANTVPETPWVDMRR